MRLTNNTILLTGGTSGIGLELLKQLYENKNRMIVTTSNEIKLASLKKQFPDITTIVCDLGDSVSVGKLIKNCIDEHSDINVLINNAGVQYNYLWTEEEDGLKKISMEICVNFTSPMQLCYGLLNILLAKESAAIINVSSGLALAPKKSAPIYCATKAAVHSATKSLRYQLENTTVKVFEIIPPPVDTAMTREQGGGKISPERVVREFLDNFLNDKFESNIGKIKFFKVIQRLSPRFADNLKKND